MPLCNAEDIDRVKSGSNRSTSFLTLYFKLLKHSRSKGGYLHNSTTRFFVRSFTRLCKWAWSYWLHFAAWTNVSKKTWKLKWKTKSLLLYCTVLPLALKLCHWGKSLSKSAKFIKANDPQYCLWKIYCCLCTSVTSCLGRQLTATSAV